MNSDIKDLVAVILAAGLVVAMVILVAGITYQAVFTSQELSDNAALVLTAVGGGIIGVLGTYLGSRMAVRPRLRR